MVMARAIERRLWVLERITRPPSRFGPAPSRAGGFEAVQVAAAAALRPGVDWVVPSGGDLALCLAMGVSPLDVMLAHFGRAADPTSGGRQAPGAFSSRAARVVSTSPSTGRHAVHAAGIAYASQVRGLPEVTLLTIDARGRASGDWHEGVNFAAVHSLPLVCLMQDRVSMQGAPVAQHASGSPVSSAPGYGIAGETIDGSDFLAAHAAFVRAADRARSGGGPTLIHAPVAELTSLSPRGAPRPPEELEALARHDGVERMRVHLLAAGVLEESNDDSIQHDCISVVEAAVREAETAPSPEGARALDNVYGTA